MKLNKIKSALKQFSNNNIFADYTSFLILSAFIGVIVGFSVVLFHNIVEILNIFLQNIDNNFQSFLNPIIIILIPTLGMLIQAILIKSFPDSANSRGVTEIIKATLGIKLKIPFKDTILNFLASTISLGTGTTLGPEAPAAFLGGGISNKLSFLFNLSDERKKLLTASGAGAAISAIFNTPLAGVFFALEIILLNDFHTTIFSSLIISSISASIVSRTFLGEDPIFSINIHETIKFSFIYLFAVFGLLSGILSYLFHQYSSFIKKFINSIYKKNVSVIIVMTIIGSLIGICGYFYPDLFGIGYITINKVLNNEIGIKIITVLFLLKFFLVPIVYNSGAFGGLFAPSLFLGAMFGYIFHFVLETLFGINLDLVSVILIGMGSFLGGIHSIPITAILMIFELTQNYSFILPLMMSVIISSLFIHIIYKKSIYLSQIDSEINYNYFDPMSQILNKTYISNYKLKEIETVNENEKIDFIIRKFLKEKVSNLYLVDNSNKISGIISENDIKFVLPELNDITSIIVAKDISKPVRFYVKNSEKLTTAFNLMNKFGLNELLVVDSNNFYPLGIIGYSDIQRHINLEYFKNNLSYNFSSEISKLESFSKVKVFENYFVSELLVPKKFIGKSLSSLKFREVFNLEVILIHKRKDSENDNKTEVIESNPHYIFKENDSILVFGKEEFINKFIELN